MIFWTLESCNLDYFYKTIKLTGSIKYVILRVLFKCVFYNVLQKYQIMEDAIKCQSTSIYKNFVCTLCCHLLNVAGCVKQTFFLSTQYFNGACNSPKA